MKLPDYSTCVEIQQLLTAMGITDIPELPVIRFEREIVHTVTHEYPAPRADEITLTLAGSAIPVTKAEIAKTADGLLEYKGRKVVAYIRDQKASVDFAAGTSGYRYHLCNCSTLQGMKEIGREHRYLATRRQDGRFTVHDLTTDPIRTGIVRMNLCSNCISLLKAKNLYTHPFDLAQYFKQFDSFTPKTIRKVEQVREIQTYSPKQADYSREYRKACNYQCQICGVNCREHQQVLHMHHIDGNPANNERHNLRILCAECHAGQPLHHHMLKNPEMVRQMTLIKTLRRQQGLLTVTTAP